MESNKKKYKCYCCDFYTLENPPDNTFQVCPVCNWEDDGVQSHDPDFQGGANWVSLNQAKENYAKFGASHERFKDCVRPPNKDEMNEL